MLPLVSSEELIDIWTWDWLKVPWPLGVNQKMLDMLNHFATFKSTIHDVFQLFSQWQGLQNAFIIWLLRWLALAVMLVGTCTWMLVPGKGMEGRGIMPLRMTIDGWQFVFPGKEDARLLYRERCQFRTLGRWRGIAECFCEPTVWTFPSAAS